MLHNSLIEWPSIFVIADYPPSPLSEASYFPLNQNRRRDASSSRHGSDECGASKDSHPSKEKPGVFAVKWKLHVVFMIIPEGNPLLMLALNLTSLAGGRAVGLLDG